MNHLFTWARKNVHLLHLLQTDHRIVRDMRAKLILNPRYGLSAKQIAFLRKLKDDANLIPVPFHGERTTFTGIVISQKEHDGSYGTSVKLTVRVSTAAGSFLLWGTCPSYHAERELVGATVTITANVKRGDKDAHFGFYSRPADMRIQSADRVLGSSPPIQSSDRVLPSSPPIQSTDRVLPSSPPPESDPGNDAEARLAEEECRPTERWSIGYGSTPIGGFSFPAPRPGFATPF